MRLYRWHIAKYCFYFIVMLIVFYLQIGQFVSLFGMSPMLLLGFSISVACFEKELPSVAFAILCGMLTDLYSVAPEGFYAFWWTIIALVVSLLTRHVLHSYYWFAVGIALLSIILGQFLLLYFGYGIHNTPGWFGAFASSCFPFALITAILSIPLYFIVKAIYKGCDRRLEIHTMM